MQQQKIENKSLVIQGLNVFYRTCGDPKNHLLVFLNGWGARTGGPFLSSKNVIQAFANQGFYVVSPEHPGLMRSDPPQSLWGPEKYVEYIEEFRKKLGLEKFILVGQSFGGAIVTLYAAYYPAQVSALVLISAGLSKDLSYRFVFDRFVFMSRFLILFDAKWIPKFFKQLLIWAALGVPYDSLKNTPIEHYRIMGEIFKSWSLPNVYSQIKAKTLLIWGIGDTLFPLSSAKKVATLIPNAKLISIRGGHSFLYIRPHKTAKLIASAVKT